MIPIFRAKKIDSDEYVEGYFYQPAHFISDGGIIIDHINYDSHRVDIATLAIHFLNMLDCQGNKIFASLSKDGKGGDMTNKGICLYEPKYNQFRIIVNLETRTWLEITREDLESYPIKVIGIQE